MRVRILCVGKLKEPGLRLLADEYKKRLSRYAAIEIIECADEPVPEMFSPQQRLAAMQKEGARLMKHMRDKQFTAILAVNGGRHSSEGFARAVQEWMRQGGATLTFIIGGSLGLSQEICARATAAISLSDMTFTHQLSRVLLLEQLYRAFKIAANEPYHK
ncbi:MAG: 23S rRNA (pseudouridine(1915)-N(3))-methyltransferase RlmH [Clostridiales bacterium]|jgi:23S rRNA (pseudouridine1915-N3)-methyltransferase|nr:23S rRNA (pseudouridine(1915)-N(3))-methyltransferase RlmH [Clostridiales bacterium]